MTRLCNYPKASELQLAANHEIQAMENEELNRFGLQFHPEVNDSEYGAKIFENFVDICRRAL